MSQGIGCICLQSEPEGQQIADVALLKAMHVVVEDGQQKSDGRPAWLQGV